MARVTNSFRRRKTETAFEVDAVTDYTQHGVRPAVEPSTPAPEIRAEGGVIDYTKGALPPPVQRMQPRTYEFDAIEVRQQKDLKGVLPQVRQDFMKLQSVIRNGDHENLTIRARSWDS